jgi:hypothetical protein
VDDLVTPFARDDLGISTVIVASSDWIDST